MKKKYFSFYLVAISFFVINSVQSQVQVYQSPLTLPTYGIEKPEIMPDWRPDRYPYTMFDRLTNEKGVKTYNALYIENEYVKALVLPEIGGRLHGIEDKTNSYQVLYDQKVIKPGLISLTGAWISGGIEWNFPKGHRPSCFRDTDWKIVENSDGSKTIWVGEIEKLKRMRWSVGTTVYPGRSWVETKIRLENCTPYIQSFQYWATSAVRATYNYQAVIPGEIMTGHGKHEFYTWPVYKGIDVTYWKNIPPASSFFAVDSESDFFGGFSPEENAGFAHVADYHIVRGKKLWTWGTAPSGRLWEKILTNGDLPYFEPQAGGYSDNQPSLLWIMPGETKVFSHFWLPVRDIGVFDYANLEGSVNLELNNETAIFGWCPTTSYNGAEITVSYGGNEIYNKKVNTDPGNPFLDKLKEKGMDDLNKLKLIVISPSGDTLFDYSHPELKHPPLPHPEPAPPKPKDVNSQDLLFTYGERFYRFNDPETGKLYFTEALERDPGDVRCNTKMGEMNLKNGLYNEAVTYFNRAIERDETCFESWYYKGLAKLNTGDFKDAEKCLNRAAYSREWYPTAHFELAQLCARQNKLDRAMEHIERSLSNNADNSQAFAVKALILIKMGEYQEALDVIHKNQETDPMDFYTKYLEIMTEKALGFDTDIISIREIEWLSLTRSDQENHIEISIRLARCGNISEAFDVLKILTKNTKNNHISPLVYYYMAYYQSIININLSTDLLSKAAKTDPTYCFPFRLETFPVLKYALSENPDDAQAHNLLAMLYKKFNQPDMAMMHWEKSATIDPNNAISLRNLGLSYFEIGELQKAQNTYQKALKVNPEAGRCIIELGQINRKLKLPYNEQIDLFENYIDVVKAYNRAAYQLVELYNLEGRYSDALNLLSSVHFNSWEGKYGVHELWIQANLAMGDKEYENSNFSEALKYYKQSLLYPDNLEVAEQPGTINARKEYKIAKTLEAMNNKDEADEYYKKVISCQPEEGSAFQYYRGMALINTGKKKEAKIIFNKMLETLDKNESDHDINTLNNKSLEMFIRSLALEGLEKTDEAKNYREKAFNIDPQIDLIAFRPPKPGF